MMSFATQGIIQAMKVIQCNCGESCGHSCIHSALQEALEKMLEHDNINDIATKNKGGHPFYPKDDWASEVMNEDTVLGYWPWVAHKIECNSDTDMNKSAPPAIFPSMLNFDKE